jgi:hypothetical protein
MNEKKKKYIIAKLIKQTKNTHDFSSYRYLGISFEEKGNSYQLYHLEMTIGFFSSFPSCFVSHLIIITC